jgi:dTDP-4-amino-4,6-dideoxygalactose transaminase
MLDHEMPRYSPPVGHNLRMGEMEALLALKQFRKIDLHVQRRRTWGRYLADKIKTLQLSGLEIDIPSGQDEHDFYILPLRVKTDLLEVHKTSIVDALRAEGMVTVVGEYGGLENLKAFEKYPRGPLRNAKLAHEREFIGLYMCGHEYSRKYLDQIANAFERIWNHIHELPREKI